LAEDCSRCTNCVKLRCLYDVYRHEAAYNRDPLTPLDTSDECKACLSCVQGCTKGLLSVSVNPEFLDLGDEYWKPDILSTTWNQSDTGRFRCRARANRGRFHGPGFDSIWTDMSEIVRPTRDGIHGREYIFNQCGYRAEAAAPAVHARRADADRAVSTAGDSSFRRFWTSPPGR